MRVLVVEDERDLAEALVRGLSRHGLAVDLAADGAQALDKTWDAVLRRHDVELDPARGLASRGGRPLDLTRKEMEVLRLLLAADGAILSAERLLEQAWDENADPFTNSVRVPISTLRQKLSPPPVIETVIGSGQRDGSYISFSRDILSRDGKASHRP